MPVHKGRRKISICGLCIKSRFCRFCIKIKKCLTICHNMGIINSAAANQDKQSGQGAAEKLNNGLSPNGKATDSDSVISRFESL